MILPTRVTIAVLATLSLGACTTAAQSQPPLRSGSRIYVVSRELVEGATIGQLRFLGRDTITMFVNPTGLVDVSVASIGQLRVSIGRDPKLIYGVPAIGAAIGALAGPVLITEPEQCKLGYADVVDCTKEVPDVVVGAAGGAILMGMLTRLIARERWVHVRLDVLLSSAVSGSSTLPISVALSF
jgi:hypothetical protein